EQQSLPLLERVKCLAIFSTNLDEFFQVRVGELKMQLETGPSRAAVTRRQHARSWTAVVTRVRELVARQSTVFSAQIAPALNAAGTKLTSWEDLDAEDVAPLDDMFAERMFPILTPLAVDPAHPFPHRAGPRRTCASSTRSRPTAATRDLAGVRRPLLARRLHRRRPGPDPASPVRRGRLRRVRNGDPA